MKKSERVGSQQTLFITLIGLLVGYFMVAFLVIYVAGGKLQNSLAWIFYMDALNYIPIAVTILAALISAHYLGKMTGAKIARKPNQYWWRGMLAAVLITMIALIAAWTVVALVESQINIASYNNMAEESYVYLVFIFVGLVAFFAPASILGLWLGARIKNRIFSRN